MTRSARAAAAALALLAGPPPGHPAGATPPPVAPTHGPREAAPRRGQAAYDAARRAAQAENLEATVAALARAVAADPEFAEAWYELGLARTNQALAAVADPDGNDDAAAHAYRAAVADLRRARALLLLGTPTSWSAARRGAAERTLDDCLREAEAVLGDDEALARAVRRAAAAGPRRLFADR